MTRPRVTAFLLACACSPLACGPGEIPEAEFREVCGQAGPFDVLTGDGEHWLSPVLIGEGENTRFVAEYEVEEGGYFERSRIWSVDPCGESPLLVAQALELVHEAPHTASVVLACDSLEGDVYAVDPQGVEAPVRLFDTENCEEAWTDAGFVDFGPRNETMGPLLLWPVPDDPWSETAEPIGLVGEVVLAGGQRQAERSPIALADEVFALRADKALVRVGLVALEQTVIAEDVFAFDASPEFIVWQTTEVTGHGIDDHPSGPIHVLIRDTGERLHLTDAALRNSFHAARPNGNGIVLGKYSHGDARLYDQLPSDEFLEAGDGARFHQHLGGRRWLMSEIENAALWIEDFATGESLTLGAGYDDEGLGTFPALWEEDSKEIAVIQLPACCNHGSTRGTLGQVWRLEPDGTRTVLAERASSHPERIPDGRILTRVDFRDDDRGTLIVVEPETLEERRLDGNVLHTPRTFGRWRDDVFYWKSEGGRQTLRRVRLAPR